MSTYRQTTPRPAAPWIGSGLALGLLAPLAFVLGGATTTAWDVSVLGLPQLGHPLVVVGSLLAVTGNVLLAVGAYRLAQHVDRLGGVRYLDATAPEPLSTAERERQAAVRRELAGD